MISWRLELFNLLRAIGTDYAYRKLQKSGGGALPHASLDCHPYGQYLTLGSTGYWGFCQGPPTPVHINLATDLVSHPPPSVSHRTMAFNTFDTLGSQHPSLERWLCSPTTKRRQYGWVKRRREGRGLPRADISSALLRLAQWDQMGFLFWMKASIPSCPSLRARLSTMAWDARKYAVLRSCGSCL